MLFLFGLFDFHKAENQSFYNEIDISSLLERDLTEKCIPKSLYSTSLNLQKP